MSIIPFPLNPHMKKALAIAARLDEIRVLALSQGISEDRFKVIVDFEMQEYATRLHLTVQGALDAIERKVKREIGYV